MAFGRELLMTRAQQERIRQRRSAGDSYAVIAASTGLPVGTIKAYCSRNGLKPGQHNAAGSCACCGAELGAQMKSRAKRFCSAACRNRWWSENRDKRLRNGASRVCANCGRQYASYDSHSKYCSHPCYIASRFGKEAQSA